MYLFFFRLLSHIGYYRVLSSLCYRVKTCWLSILNIVVCFCWFQPSNLSPPLKKITVKDSLHCNKCNSHVIYNTAYIFTKMPFFSLASSPSPWLLNLNFEFNTFLILSSPISSLSHLSASHQGIIPTTVGLIYHLWLPLHGLLQKPCIIRL